MIFILKITNTKLFKIIILNINKKNFVNLLKLGKNWGLGIGPNPQSPIIF